LLIRCERVRKKNGLTYSYVWEQPGCSAYIPPCSNAVRCSAETSR
jgi:hypothetical protein